MPETSDPHRCTCRGGLLLLSPGTALANRWPLSGPAAPHQQCLILNAWTLLSVGVLLPLAMLHRMERLARLSAAGVAAGKGEGKRWWVLTLFVCGLHVWSMACIVLL